MRDALVLRGLRFFGHHGVLPAERALGQRFVVDMRVGFCLRKAGASDALDDTLSYVALREAAREVVEGKPRDLVEAVAADIAGRVLREHPGVEDVKVCVTKPHVAIENVDALGVEVFRTREDFENQDASGVWCPTPLSVDSA
jgi:7,8-dihydroneopterin aldolase/epimerase/oxygenase